MDACDYCHRTAVYVGEDREGFRIGVCEIDRPTLRWDWLKTLDGRFPVDPNALILSYPAVA